MSQAQKEYAVKTSILIVEDDYTLREAMVDTLSQAGFDCMAARNGEEALALMDQFGFKLVLSDLQMPQMDGLTLVPQILAKKPYMPIIIMTAYGSVEKAVEAIKLGATDFINKPFDCQALVEKIQHHTQFGSSHSAGNAAAQSQVKNIGKEKACNRSAFGNADAVWDLHSQSPVMQQALNLAKRVAATDATVLINGASGTGKEVISRFIHEHSDRAEGPFVAINCAAIPENMLEAILFGHEKGAFTGALAAMPGKFEQANGGTLLLDEVTEMPLGLQAKLLRVLQEKEVERLGGKKIIPLNVRVLATSNRDLALAVQQGKFREDLFYRLNVFPVRLPTLAERAEDILPLVKFLLKKHGGKRTFTLSEAATAQLTAYAWPGNIRELENVVQRAIVLSEGDQITPESVMIEPLGFDVAQRQVNGLAGINSSDVIKNASTDEKSDMQLDGQREAQNNRQRDGASVTPLEASSQAAGVVEPEGLATGGAANVLEENLRQQEHRIIIDVLRQTGGRRKAAAEKLGISARTLRYKLARLKSLGIDVDELLEA